MIKLNTFMGLGFSFDLLSDEESEINPCVFHKLGSEEPLPCDERPRVGVTFGGNITPICAEHFEIFATDMVDALSIFADAKSLDAQPEVIINKNDASACTKSAFIEIFMRVKEERSTKH